MASNAVSRLDRLTRRLDELDKVLVSVAGKAVHDAVLEQAMRDTGDGRMSGVGKNGLRLDVQITPLNNPLGVRIRPKGKQSGPWTMLSTGTSPHVVAAKTARYRRGGGRSSRTTAMRIGSGDWHAGPWRVGGARGKQTWTKGRESGFDEAMAEVERRFGEVVEG